MILSSEDIMLQLIQQMLIELKEYKEEYYASPKWYSLKSDNRFTFMQDVYENALSLNLTEKEIKALLAIDGVLSFCWDVWYEFRCPKDYVLITASHFVLSGVVEPCHI